MIETIVLFIGVIIGIAIGGIWGIGGAAIGGLVGRGVAAYILVKVDEEKKNV